MRFGVGPLSEFVRHRSYPSCPWLFFPSFGVPATLDFSVLIKMGRHGLSPLHSSAVFLVPLQFDLALHPVRRTSFIGRLACLSPFPIGFSPPNLVRLVPVVPIALPIVGRSSLSFSREPSVPRRRR